MGLGWWWGVGGFGGGGGKGDPSTLSAQSENIASKCSQPCTKLLARANDIKKIYSRVSFYDGVTLSNIWL